MPQPIISQLVFRSTLAAAIAVAMAIPGSAAQPQESNNGQCKHLDIQSSAGDLHVGNDADARKAGLPLYPGARLRTTRTTAMRSILALSANPSA